MVLCIFGNLIKVWQPGQCHILLVGFRLALIQFVASANKSDNLKKAAQFARDAAHNGAQILAFFVSGDSFFRFVIKS